MDMPDKGAAAEPGAPHRELQMELAFLKKQGKGGAKGPAQPWFAHLAPTPPEPGPAPAGPQLAHGSRRPIDVTASIERRPAIASSQHAIGGLISEYRGAGTGCIRALRSLSSSYG